jgi:maltose alpha-D-glucosyltransferase/alpha-amylase
VRDAAEPALAAPHGAYLELARVLATRTAGLHAAFAQRTGDPAFDPEPATDADMTDWKKRARAEAAETVALPEQRLADLPPAAREEALGLVQRRGELLGRIDACRLPAAILKTRFHGDYHLGQVLLAKNDFLIIDFEGEPARPIAGRSAKGSALRDVAGMLRSFDYARASALGRVARNDADLERLRRPAQEWAEQARQAYLESYGASHALDAGLLRLFELEKALYELRYEIGNRPDWVRIPLQGILALIA